MAMVLRHSVWAITGYTEIENGHGSIIYLTQVVSAYYSFYLWLWQIVYNKNAIQKPCIRSTFGVAVTNAG